MAGLDFPRLNQSTPESIVDDYLQRGLQDIQDKYTLQWNEVNKRGDTLGGRKQMEMLSNIDMKAKQEIQAFRQSAQQQQDQLAQIDQLARQGGFNPYEAKMRMVLGTEAEAAMFPKTGRSVAAQFGELDVYENRLISDAGNFLTDPGGRRIKEPLKFWFSEKKTRPLLKVWDPNLDPKFDKEKNEWMSGGYRTANQEDIRRKLLIDEELKNIQRQKRELLGQPDIVTRVRGTMLRVKRSPVHDSLTTRVQNAAGVVEPGTEAPRKQPVQEPQRRPATPTAEQLRKTGTKQAFELGVSLGYWE